MSRFKWLPGTSKGKLKRLSEELNHAHYSYDSLLEAHNYLIEIDSQFSKNNTTISFQPSLYYALVKYCSIFNSSNRNHHGVSRYSARDLFRDTDRLRVHELIVSYRDKEIAHVTNFSKRQEVIYDSVKNEMIVYGSHSRPMSANLFQPQSDSWEKLLEHFFYSKEWLLERIKHLNEEIPLILSSCSPDFLDSLADVNSDMEKRLTELEKLREQQS